MGIFFKVLATKHAIFKFYGSWLREAINKVEGRRRDSWRQLSTFFLSPEKGNKKKLWVVAVTHGDNPKFVLVARRNVTRKS